MPRPFPSALAPQLATLVSAPPAGDDWLHEMKYDGYRILAHAEGGRVQLKSRRAIDWTPKFPTVAAAVAKLPASAALLDGEVAVPMPDGRTSFGALQEALSPGVARGVVYFVFDLLHLDGRDLTRVPLEARKLTLRALLLAAPPGLPIRYSDHVVGRGPEFFAQVRARGLEGMVSKRRHDVHRAGRSPGWLKIKATSRQELVVGGFTEPEGAREAFGSLLLGTYDATGKLIFAGGVGTGFDDATLRTLGRRLRAMETPSCPFTPKPAPALLRRPARWVRPELVAEVEFQEWTGDGHLRHPSFRGLRDDRDPRDIRREEAVPLELALPSGPPPEPEPQAEPEPEVAPAGAPVVLGQHLSNPDRVFYPALGTTKLDLARYYEAVGAAMLPHVQGRPLTLVRCPEGLGKECFYTKHVATGARSPLVKILIREKDSATAKKEPYLLVRDHAGLVALAQLGVLEIHSWNCTDAAIERPNQFVMDLDPGPAVPFAEVIAGARLVRDVLRAVGFESWVKTTGGKGLHVVVPLAPRLDWDAILALSRAIAGLVVRQQPRKYTINLAKAGREDKILIDYLRNHRGSTSVAAFSTRARPEATVSVPIAWDEIDDVAPGRYTIANVPQRLRELRKDPWADFYNCRQPVRDDVAQLLLPEETSQ